MFMDANGRKVFHFPAHGVVRKSLKKQAKTKGYGLFFFCSWSEMSAWSETDGFILQTKWIKMYLYSHILVSEWM